MAPPSPALAQQASGRHGRLLLVAFWLLLTCLLLWPAIVNKGPFLFPDTGTYIRSADAAVYKVTGRSTIWSDELHKRYTSAIAPAARTGAGQASSAAPKGEDDVVLAGRSIYYGFLAYLLSAGGTFWLLLAMQAAVVSAAMVLAYRCLADQRLHPLALLLCLIPLLTSAGFFVSFVMPDWLMPVGLVATAMIFEYWKEMGRPERGFWLVVLSLALLAHSANVVIIGGLGLLLVAAKALRLRQGRLLPILCAIVVGIAGESLFSAAVNATTGAPPVRPPFLMARLIADGPGTDYLNQVCPQREDAFIACRFRKQLPVHSDTFLWGPHAPGVFSALSPREKRALAAEQGRFALAVFRHDPVAVVRSSFGSFASQLGSTELSEFNGPTITPTRFPDPFREEFLGTRAARGTMPIALPSKLAGPLAILSLAVVAVGAWLARRKNGGLDQVLSATLIILTGIVLNAFVCGAVSTPHDRYQARVLWLLPFVALALAIRLYRARSGTLAATARIADVRTPAS